MRQSKFWVSLFIVLVIALHAVPLVSAGLRRKVWPFLEWAMYKRSHPPGPIKTVTKRITGVTSKGQRVAVTPYFVGLSKFALLGLYEVPMWRGDTSAAQQLFRRLNSGRGDPFIELNLESETHTVTDTGVVKQQNSVITYRAPLSRSE